MNYEIRGVREGDLPYLADNLRSADTRELIATYGNLRFLEGLTKSVRASDEALVAAGDHPIVIWGFKRLNPASALIWACATPEIKQYQIPFLRNCRPIIKSWFERFPEVQYLMNFTHGSNALHHKWLEWCGAEMLPEIPFGKLGEPFRPFTIRRSKYDV